ncbi:TLR adapter interacting with SLC15A4 on the lysosome [Aplochiton taeniatus]
MEIPGKVHSGGDVPFLVPSSCQSICENYSDLHIGGDQVLPLSAHKGELLPCSENQAEGPFLQSCDVPPAGEESLSDPTCQAGPKMRGGSSRWKQVSVGDRSFLFQGLEGPFSNSLLNRYLEHKLLDLYQQYMLENMAKHGAGSLETDPSSPGLLLGSELILTSLDQITQQLSREGNLEAGRAKDMVISCLLRVAGSLQSTEISTPMLQISTETFGNEPTGTSRGPPAPYQGDRPSADPSLKD